MEISNFSHTGNVGDCWASMPAMRQYYRKTGKKINLYLVKNILAEYYEGAVHPTKNEQGHSVMLNDKMIEMMKPLFLTQEYINDVITITREEYNTTDILCHLDWVREGNVGMPNFPIQKWYSSIYPDLDFDLADKWLDIPDSENDLARGKIIITRSERYRNESLDYSFLKPYEDDLLFCGTMREYNQFCMTFDLNIRKLNISNFLELAQAIKQARFHISNQTQAFQLSEGQKTPRILEACVYAPNCIPVGKDAMYYLNQLVLIAHFHKLNGSMSEREIGEKLIQETNNEGKKMVDRIEKRSSEQERSLTDLK